MRDILDAVQRWFQEGHRFAIAIVASTWGSSPRPAGSMLAVCEDGRTSGSVSGGCVEGAVIEEALRVITSGRMSVLEFEGMDPEDVWRVGLSCGGRIMVVVCPVPAWHGLPGLDLDHEASPALSQPSGHPWDWPPAFALARGRKPFVLVVSANGAQVVEPSRPFLPRGERVGIEGVQPDELRERTRERHPGAGSPPEEDRVQRALQAYESRESGEHDGVFYFVHRRPDRLLIVGGVHIAIPLLRLARELDFETILIEPRPAFATGERFEAAPDETYTEWPDQALAKLELDDDTYAVLLTHDPKIDDVALRILLKSPVRYIGALGSRTTQAQRRARLLEEGFTQAEVDRISGPVGLPIGAKTPAEIALSIMAEMVQVRRGS